MSTGDLNTIEQKITQLVNDNNNINNITEEMHKMLTDITKTKQRIENILPQTVISLDSIYDAFKELETDTAIIKVPHQSYIITCSRLKTLIETLKEYSNINHVQIPK